MKKFKNIYTLFIVFLLGFVSFACSDDDVEQSEEKTNRGKLIETTIEVNIAAPDMSVDLETRAGVDIAKIDNPKAENGGLFQNVIIVLADNSNKVYAIHSHKWYDGQNPTESAGVKEYKVTLGTMKLDVANAKVYAFGNVSADVYEKINSYSVGESTNLSSLSDLNKLVTKEISYNNSLYSLKFTPKAGNYKVNGTLVNQKCTGMPVNAVATAENKDGTTVFNVVMKRVCARLQVTFKNNTSNYNNNSTLNDIYIDSFIIKGVLAENAKYLYDGTTPSEGKKDFKLLDALGVENTHEGNIVKRTWSGSEDLVVSIYVFENVNNGYTYDLKVDKGKSLGSSTKYLEVGNVYAIWNGNEGNLYDNNNKALAYNNGTIKASQQNPNNFNYNDQIFWELELGSASGNSHMENNASYVLKHYPINEKCVYDKSKDDNKNIYFSKQNGGKFIESPAYDKQQYLWFETEYGKKFQINFCGSVNDGVLEYRGIVPIPIYHCLTINRNGNLENYEKLRANDTKYDWTFYSKYIIKRGEPLKEIINGTKQSVQKIARNNSYDLTFNISTNKEVETYLYVLGSVRTQETITNWVETQK